MTRKNAQMHTLDKVLENRLRRVLYRMGYRLEKSKQRDPRGRAFGRFAIFHVGPRNDVAFGMSWQGYRHYELTLEQVRAFVDDGVKPDAQPKNIEPFPQ